MKNWGLLRNFSPRKTLYVRSHALSYEILGKVCVYVLARRNKIPELIAERPITNKTIGVYFEFDEEEKEREEDTQ